MIVTQVTTIEDIRIDKMALDMSYQRTERPTVHKIIKTFDPRLLRPLVVSERDDKYYVVDGQHRFQALKYLGVEKVRCEVFHGLTSKEEAEIFSKQNNNVAPLRPLDTFKSNIHIGDRSNIDVIIYDTIISKKLTIARHSHDKGFRCLSGLREAVRLHGAFIMEYLCDVIIQSGWVSYIDAYSRDIQETIITMYKRGFSIKKVVDKLKQTTPLDLKRAAIIKYGLSTLSTISRYLESLITGEIDS